MMITVAVSTNGYYVVGEGTEATMRCHPATDDFGTPIFHELHHAYKVMFLALQEVARIQNAQGDVIVYNDSRIIDELNGTAPPLDDTCRRWLRAIRRELVPSIRSVVIFRKKSNDYIKMQIKAGESLLATNDPVLLAKLAHQLETNKRETLKNRKARILDCFKRIWRNDKQQ